MHHDRPYWPCFANDVNIYDEGKMAHSGRKHKIPYCFDVDIDIACACFTVSFCQRSSSKRNGLERNPGLAFTRKSNIASWRK